MNKLGNPMKTIDPNAREYSPNATYADLNEPSIMSDEGDNEGTRNLKTIVYNTNA
jgi:hypothetical protein